MKLYKRMAALFLSVAAVSLLIPAAASAAEAIDLLMGRERKKENIIL